MESLESRRDFARVGPKTQFLRHALRHNRKGFGSYRVYRRRHAVEEQAGRVAGGGRMAARAGRAGNDRPSGIRPMGRGKLATPGVRAPTARSIEIDFYYRGVRCRERLKLAPTPANQRYASRLRGEIESRIARGDFNYAEFFP